MERRAEVATLTRNIRIASLDSDPFGCRVLIAAASSAASALLRDVEISGCGQQGTEYPALELQGGSNITIEATSIHSSTTSGVAVNGTSECVFANNVLFNISEVFLSVANSSNTRWAFAIRIQKSHCLLLNRNCFWFEAFSYSINQLNRTCKSEYPKRLDCFVCLNFK